MKKQRIHTDHAPQAIGPYSQAIRANDVVYFSGQIPLDPATMTLVGGGINEQAERVFLNMRAVAEAANASLNDIVKLTIYLTDLNDFSVVNAAMMRFFAEPYPARTTIQVSALPKEALVEVDAVMLV